MHRAAAVERHSVTLLCCVSFALVLAAPAPAVAKPRVEIEVIAEGRFSSAVAQRWSKLLGDAGFDNVRIRSGRAGEPQIENVGTAANPSYKLVGILAADERLVLKGGKFGVGDLGRLKQFVDKLAELTSEPAEKKGAFGLAAKELIAVLSDLEPALDFETQDAAPATLVQKIGGLVKTALAISPAAEKALSEAEPCRDELEGISAGTALAALLRPEGLVLVPRAKGATGKVQLLITTAEAGQEVWPIGWPSEKTPRELLPVLYENLNVEIGGIQLPEALAAIQERVGIPFLFDHNSIAERQIEPEKVEVSFPAGKTFYKKVLDRLLYQAKLKGELRTDEAGKPLLWITVR